MRSLCLRLLPLFLLVVVGLASLPSLAAEPCQNPQTATASLLDNLQPGKWKPDDAAACLEVPPDRTGDAGRLAIKLKKVLDARGLYVPTTELPTDPDYVDELGRERLEPLSQFSEVVIVKRGDKWLYSRGTVEQIDALYAETFSGVSQALQEFLPEFFMRRVGGIELWQVVWFLVLLGLSVLVGRVGQSLLADQFLRLARRLGVPTTADLLKRTRGPLTWVAGSLVFLWGIPDLQLSVRPSMALLLVARLVLAASVVVVSVRIVDVIADIWAGKVRHTDSRIDDQLVPLARKASKVLIAIIAILVVVENMGVDVAGLIAGLGIGGLAVALAAKDTLENVFGSAVIFLDRPFQVGDWVVIDGDVEGVVEEVGFRTTRVRTFYNSVLAVPNGKVAMAKVDNYAQRKVRRMKMTLGLTYDTPRDKVEAFVDGVRSQLQADEQVWDKTLEVHFHSFGDSALNVLVYAFLDVPDWTAELEARQRLMLGFMGLAEELGIGFAFPTQTVHLESVPAGFGSGEG